MPGNDSEINLAALNLWDQSRRLLTTQFDVHSAVRSRKRLESRRKVCCGKVVWDTHTDSTGQLTDAHGCTRLCVQSQHLSCVAK
jgi:hypothetical protein